MSEQRQSEQSMDEILASIRKIISDEPPTRPENRLPTPSDLQPVPSGHRDGGADANDDLGDILEPINETLKEALEEPPRPAEAVSAPIKDGHDVSWPFDVRPSASAAPAEPVAFDPPQVAPGESSAAEPSYPASPAGALSPAIDRIGAAADTMPQPAAVSSNEAAADPRDTETSQPTVAVAEEPAPAAATPVRLGPSLHPRPAAEPVPERVARTVSPAEESAPEAPAALEPVVPNAVAPVRPIVPVPAEMSPVEPEVEPEPPKVRPGVDDAAAAAIIHAATQEAYASPDLGKRTLEDVVVEALRPMLQEWIDQNLPRIANEVVKSELSRISDDPDKGAAP